MASMCWCGGGGEKGHNVGLVDGIFHFWGRLLYICLNLVGEDCCVVLVFYLF